MRGRSDQGADSARPQLAVIVGGAGAARSAPPAVDWFVEQAWEHSTFDLDVVDLVDLGLPDILTGGAPVPGAGALLSPRLRAADALVVALPEYSYSFPEPVKRSIGRFRDDWAAKPVVLISYGAVSGGLRPVDYLRLFTAELRAPTFRETVAVHRYWELLDIHGRPYDPDGCRQAATGVLDQLAWWVRTTGQQGANVIIGV